MDSISTDFGDVLLWALLVLHLDRSVHGVVPVHLRHVRRPHAQRLGQGRVGRPLIFVPWLGALIYLIVRGRSMTERHSTALEERKAQAAQDQYIKKVASPATSAADQIASAGRRSSTQERSTRTSSPR